MSRPLRALIVEDREEDAELVLLELLRGGYAAEWERVFTPEDFRAALRRKHWDVILADYQMPRFTALAALEVLKSEQVDLPFILVSGSVGEAIAVQAMKAGAHDFFPKANLTRLTAAIEREVAEAQVQRERKEAMEQLRQAEERYRLVIEHLLDYAIFYLDPEGRVATWSPGAQRILGYGHSEISGHSIELFYPEEERGRAAQDLHRARTGGSVHEEGWIVRSGDVRFWAERSFEVIQEGGLLRAPEPVVGLWDRLRLEGVIHNLLENALKYGARKPIEISVKRHEDKARLTFTDQGIGIPPEEQSRIFERFERAVPKRHYGGLGIGLWIVRQSVEAHGGCVHVVSKEGRGATFTVMLPLGVR